MATYLFFNTSANGKPKNWKAAPNDAFSWPRMIHLSWLLYNDDRELIDSRNDVIKPVGFTVEPTIEKISKVTAERIENEGVDLKEALEAFSLAVKKADYIVAHNMRLHQGVVGAEFHRKSVNHLLQSSDLYCLMQESTWYTKIPAKGGEKYKWPTLQEVHQSIYEAQYANGGDAETDVATTAICTFHLVDIEAFEFF